MKELINDIERIAKALPHMSRLGIESLASELLDIADRMRDELEDARLESQEEYPD